MILAANDEGYVITAGYKKLLYVEEIGIMFDQNYKALCFKIRTCPWHRITEISQLNIGLGYLKVDFWLFFTKLAFTQLGISLM